MGIGIGKEWTRNRSEIGIGMEKKDGEMNLNYKKKRMKTTSFAVYKAKKDVDCVP